MWVPIMILAWIIPYSNPKFVTSYDVFYGNTVYILMMFIFGSVVQFGLGYTFYIGAYRALK